jgi:hypothetical protein
LVSRNGGAWSKLLCFLRRFFGCGVEHWLVEAVFVAISFLEMIIPLLLLVVLVEIVHKSLGLGPDNRFFITALGLEHVYFSLKICTVAAARSNTAGA